MNDFDAIIIPQKGKRSPHLGPVAVIAGTETDLFQLCKLLDFDGGTYQKLFTSRLYRGHANPSAAGVSITGPIVGAPYAVMVLETLIAWGARKIIFIGWCGSISDKIKIGDIIVATSAIIDEGTSGHYTDNETRISFPSASMLTKLNDALRQNQANFHNGAIWSTDAIYRETCEKVKYFQRQDAIGVEMEISALFTVAKFRGVDLGAMAVVSDELSSFKWRPGFKMDEFKHGRKTACTVIKDLCRKM
ncbi:MAG: nucleoside phosphorylase [Desulfobacterales bacterium]|nr:nucleoside phosphorylase [Desulfobacterales bacterium]